MDQMRAHIRQYGIENRAVHHITCTADVYVLYR